MDLEIRMYLAANGSSNITVDRMVKVSAKTCEFISRVFPYNRHPKPLPVWVFQFDITIRDLMLAGF